MTEEISKNLMRIACITMQKNEDMVLKPWILYHGYHFGFENLFIIDHGSDNSDVIKTLEIAEANGVNVNRISADVNFRLKGELVSDALRQADSKGIYDFLLPIDCDEFLAARTQEGKPTCSRRDISLLFCNLIGESRVLEIKENFLNWLGHPAKYLALPYQKVFFARGCCGSVDPGSHRGISLKSSESLETPFSYIHFHNKSYEAQVRLSRDKLKPFVDVDDRAALEQFQGDGWHLVSNLLLSREDWERKFESSKNCIFFPEIIDLFFLLGIDPFFCGDQEMAMRFNTFVRWPLPQKLPKDFDPERYLALNPDVREGGADPVRHWQEYGYREGRQWK